MKKKKLHSRHGRKMKRARGIAAFRGINHCTKCKDGRLIILKERAVAFCGYCGYEPKIR